MATSVELPPAAGKATTAAAPASESEARAVAEAARETEWTYPSFIRELFLGRFRLDLIHPHPRPNAEAMKEAQPFLDKLRALLERVDSDAIDREGQVPEWVVKELKAMGAFGIKIPKEYGGLGLSILAYVRAMGMVTSKDGSLTAMLSASQSIGVPQPLALFGTEEQKRRYFPRLAKGAISAFALTEVDAGSDPANMTTSAVPSEDGSYFTINGDKLWTTNGTVAELFVVMARTPDRVVDGTAHKQITAFIVERDMPGVEVAQRLHFMGLKAIENGHIRFTNVRVPRENILLGEGKGLKLALTTLNTGRLSLPGACTGIAKAMVEVTRIWANQRVQWGQPIGRHEAVGHKLASMTSMTFAMEAVAELATLLYEKGHYDIRLEAAIAKLYNTEAGWRIVDDTLQIRGGRGYETADSLASRGEPRIPIERVMRDFRINLIFEGSSEIMRLFIAREAVDFHLKTAGPLIDPKSTFGQKLGAVGRILRFYPVWFLSLWVGKGQLPSYGEFGRLAGHMRFVERETRRLARAITYAMVRYGPKLERRQMVLFRAVDIGAELFAMSAACVRAQMLEGDGQPEAVTLADVFCRGARDRVKLHFRQMFDHNDASMNRLSRQVLDGQHKWLESGIVGVMPAAAKPQQRVGN